MPGVCDNDGTALYQRVDDRRETAENRLHVYFEQTTPVIDYYRPRGVLDEINGLQPIEQVTARLCLPRFSAPNRRRTAAKWRPDSTVAAFRPGGLAINQTAHILIY